MLGTKEFYELMDCFEKSPLSYGYRKDRSDKEIWRLQSYYQHGELNELFIAFMHGYMLHKSISNAE